LVFLLPEFFSILHLPFFGFCPFFKFFPIEKLAFFRCQQSWMSFFTVRDDLVKTLDQYKVPEREKNELLALLAPMRADIVQAS